MKRQKERDEDRKFVLGILTGRDRGNAASMEEIQDITDFSREKIRKIIHELAVKDKVEIALKPEFPYGFYIKTEEL
jgi:hypothetical protein